MVDRFLAALIASLVFANSGSRPRDVLLGFCGCHHIKCNWDKAVTGHPRLSMLKLRTILRLTWSYIRKVVPHAYYGSYL